MTPAQAILLSRAADMSHLPGTATLYEAQAGYMLQVRQCLAKKWIRYIDRHSRLVITDLGRKEWEAYKIRRALAENSPHPKAVAKRDRLAEAIRNSGVC